MKLADSGAAETARRLLSQVLTGSAPAPHPWVSGSLLVSMPGAARGDRHAIEALFRHPSCGARALAVHLARIDLADAASAPPWIEGMVGRALAADCWRLQAAALAFLEANPGLADVVGETPAHVPGFLRHPARRARGDGASGR